MDSNLIDYLLDELGRVFHPMLVYIFKRCNILSQNVKRRVRGPRHIRQTCQRGLKFQPFVFWWGPSLGCWRVSSIHLCRIDERLGVMENRCDEKVLKTLNKQQGEKVREDEN